MAVDIRCCVTIRPSAICIETTVHTSYTAWLVVFVILDTQHSTQRASKQFIYIPLSLYVMRLCTHIAAGSGRAQHRSIYSLVFLKYIITGASRCCVNWRGWSYIFYSHFILLACPSLFTWLFIISLHFFTSLLTKNSNIIYNVIKYYEVLFCVFLLVVLLRRLHLIIRFIKEPRYFS